MKPAMPEIENPNDVPETKSYLKTGLLTPRFLKFGVVGASGVVVNMGGLYLFKEFAGIPYFIASLFAIELSILSNFTVNLLWTWRDRAGEGTLWTKILRYHIGAGATAFLGNYLVLIALTELLGLHYMVSNLIGIAVGTLSNYIINDLWTFRKHS
ncbi:MAG: Dolichyl-phosphate beta-D-mannosyltransferase [Bacteroidetes bacterium]|nr:Dolichyl-phosphate beta-D-mannosyltransferase [Bacteroidota bacterium]